MNSQDLIDAQFDRAVEIVQSLPKTGPIQTDYDEKLSMYSLYKQATIGDVQSPRPAIWDVLGRAKWDAWAKHKHLETYEAKWLYVDALLKVLSKYSDKTVAMNLIQELESYGGDPSNLVSSHTLSKSPGSDSSGSTVSDRAEAPDYDLRQSSHDHASRAAPGQEQDEEQEQTSDEEDTEDEEAHELPIPLAASQTLSQSNRPQSSLSSHRYRTPMAGSLALSPPPSHGIPDSQPLPSFETPSAFAEPPSISSLSSQYPTPTSHVGHFSETSRTQMVSPHIYPINQPYRSQALPRHQYGPVRPASRLTLERSVENVQTHLAALTERLELLESMSHRLPGSGTSSTPHASGSPPWGVGRGSPAHGRGGVPEWDIDDLGMWSLVLNPVSRALDMLRQFAAFFARNENRSPSSIVLRRLCLDVSFLICVVALIRAVWKRSGVRRREVRAALVVLWRAILGTKPDRALVDRGV